MRTWCGRKGSILERDQQGTRDQARPDEGLVRLWPCSQKQWGQQSFQGKGAITSLRAPLAAQNGDLEEGLGEGAAVSQPVSAKRLLWERRRVDMQKTLSYARLPGADPARR